MWFPPFWHRAKLARSGGMLRNTPANRAGRYQGTPARKTGGKKPGISGFFQGQIVTVLSLFITLFPHALPAPSAVSLGLTGVGAVGLPPLREKGPPADGAQAGVRGRAVLADRGRQHRVKGQNGLPEVAAVGTRPAFPHHIALTV